MARPLPRSSLLPPVPWRRALRRARRSLALRWLLVALAAAAVAVQARVITAEVEAERDAWGTAASVVVVVRDVAAGTAVDAGDVRVERRPAAVVPAGAVSEPPVGRLATARLVAGEVVVSSRLAPAGLSAVAALVPEGSVAVAVPTSSSGLGAPAPPLTVGDRVDVLAPGPVTVDAVVVAVDDGAVTIAVALDDVADVAEAVTSAVVTIALRGATGTGRSCRTCPP